jgi:hypothetical protein
MLESLFGPSKDEIWNRLAQELGKGEFIKGNFWQGTRDKVEVEFKNWIITLDTHTVSTGKSTTVFTRIRAPYLNKDGFRFRIYRKMLFSGIAKFFGMQDIEVGYPEFDHNFIIQGNDEQKVKKLFSNQNIRDLINLQPAINFWVRDDEGFFARRYPEGVDLLSFQVLGVLKDLDRLKNLYELFSETLHYLCLMDSAYERDPNFKI